MLVAQVLLLLFELGEARLERRQLLLPLDRVLLTLGRPLLGLEQMVLRGVDLGAHCALDAVEGVLQRAVGLSDRRAYHRL